VATTKICATFFLTEPLPRPRPLGRAEDGLGASSIKALLFVGLTRAFTLATDGEECRSRCAPPGRSIMKVVPQFISSNLSISDHNSPILVLNDPSGASLPPSARWGSTCEGKIDKSQEIEISTTTALGMSRSIISKSRTGSGPCGTCAG
jgi:hypothetical protein